MTFEPRCPYAKNSLSAAYQVRLSKVMSNPRKRAILCGRINRRENKTGRVRAVRTEGAEGVYVALFDLLAHVDWSSHRIVRHDKNGNVSGYPIRLRALNSGLTESRQKRAQHKLSANCMIGSKRNKRSDGTGYKGTASTRWLTPSMLALFALQKEYGDYMSKRKNPQPVRRSPEEIAEDLQSAAHSRKVIKQVASGTFIAPSTRDDAVDRRAELEAQLKAIADNPHLSGDELRATAARYRR